MSEGHEVQIFSCGKPGETTRIFQPAQLYADYATRAQSTYFEHCFLPAGNTIQVQVQKGPDSVLEIGRWPAARDLISQSPDARPSRSAVTLLSPAGEQLNTFGTSKRQAVLHIKPDGTIIENASDIVPMKYQCKPEDPPTYLEPGESSPRLQDLAQVVWDKGQRHVLNFSKPPFAPVGTEILQIQYV